jgi:hypothetical protein
MENWKVIGVVYWRINVRITTATTGEGDGGGTQKNDGAAAVIQNKKAKWFL